MTKTPLERAILEAARQFALQVVEVVKASTLQELLKLEGNASPHPQPGRKPAAAKEATAPASKLKKLKNYPKCAYPKCNKNRFVRGKGFCGDHWRAWLDGKIKAADAYKSDKKPTAKRVVKKRAKKKAAAKK